MIYNSNTHAEAEQLYNLTMIDKMCRGNEDSVKKMVGVFIRQIAQSVEEISNANQKADLEKIKNEIHKIKPTLSYYGTIKIEKELLALEKLITETSTGQEIEINISTLNTIKSQTIAKMKSDFSLPNN